MSLNDFFFFSFFLFFFPQIFNTQDRLGSVWYYWLGCHMNFSSLGYTTTKFKPWPSVAAGHPSFDCNPIFRMENASLSIFFWFISFLIFSLIIPKRPLIILNFELINQIYFKVYDYKWWSNLSLRYIYIFDHATNHQLLGWVSIYLLDY